MALEWIYKHGKIMLQGDHAGGIITLSADNKKRNVNAEFENEQNSCPLMSSHIFHLLEIDPFSF